MHISSKCSIAIHCLIYINEYGEKRKVTSERLASSTGCNAATIRSIMSALKNGGIINVKFGTGGAAMAMSPDKIDLNMICQLVDPEAYDHLIGRHSSPFQGCPVGANINDILNGPYGRVSEALKDSMSHIRLDELIEDYRVRTRDFDTSKLLKAMKGR